MGDNNSSSGRVTRRRYIRGGALIGSGLIAGCINNTDSSDETPTQEDSTDTSTNNTNKSTGGSETTKTEATETETKTATETETTPTEEPDESYSVSIAPMGEVTFDSPPETVFTRLTHHADMAFALGHGDGVNAMHAPKYYHALWNQFVERLPDVTLDWTGLYSSWQPSKEKLYDLDSDVHLADPAWITQQNDWNREDIDEIASKVSPWFGNSLSDSHQKPPKEWADSYEYYGLWEQFGIVAEMFQEQERYQALKAEYDAMVSAIESGLPPESERPTAVMIAASDVDEIYSYPLDTPGFLTAHTAPFGAKDAFEGSVEPATVIDFEVMLDGNPDVILYLGGMEPTTNMQKRRDLFKSDPVAGEVTAVKNDRVYAQGARYQGPILNLFQLEMTAKQLYPDQFGEWPTYAEGPYPEIADDEQLFDRQRVADIINGDFE